MTYTVDRDFERIDRIARDLYGSERGGTLELLLSANPGLADRLTAQHAHLRRGDTITLPPRPGPALDPAIVRPWE